MTDQCSRQENVQQQQQQQQSLLREIDVCSSNMFGWLDRGMVSTTLATISADFDALVHAHLFGSNRSVGRLEIWRALNGEGPELIERFEDGFYKKLAIPQTPPPDNFIGFKSICIRYIDDTVVAFLHRIRRLFRHLPIALKLSVWPQSFRAWHVVAQQIWPLAVKNVCQLSVDSYVLPRLRQFVSPSVLCDCANLCQIESDGLFPEGPPDDHPRASHAQALAKWLHTPREDGKPKLLRVEAWTGQFHEQIEQLKQLFLVAASPVHYAVRLSVHLRGLYVPFAVDNNQTRERLTFCRIDNNSCDALWLLRRAPSDETETVADDGKADSAEDAVADCWRWTIGHSALRVQFEDRDIGPLSVQ